MSSQSLSEQMNSLVLMYQLQSLLIEIKKNIGLISTGARGALINVNGGSLFSLAAQYYSDATLWTVIAAANGLIDPELPVGVPMQLVIPITGTNTGGVLGI